MSGLPSASSQRGVTVGSQKAIAVALTDDSGNKGLLFYSGLGAEGGSHIMHIPHLIPLVCGQGSNDPISASGHSTIDSKCCGLISGHISVISVEANGTTTA